jgi:hypothetical protein
MAKRAVPKGCVVHSIEIRAKGAEVRHRCHGETGGGEYRYKDENGNEVIGNYPVRFIRGVDTVRIGSVSVGGKPGTTVHGFMDCHKDRRALLCKAK